jgi:dolichol-phosphate mannosyltransferase
VERTFAATNAAGLTAEMIIVDDNSNDGTEETVAKLAVRFPVRLVVRRNERGLSSAVLRGFSEARHDRLLVMDADLQHPPELVPALLEKLETPGCEFVIATRYSGQSSIAEHWPLYRRLASKVATALAKPLAHLSDPMSGFFALRREVWERAERLSPLGYKIALELFVKGRCRRAEEVPIHFATRRAGESKAGLREFVHYLRHLWRLYWFRFPGVIVLGFTMVVAVLVGMVYAVWW